VSIALVKSSKDSLASTTTVYRDLILILGLCGVVVLSRFYVLRPCPQRVKVALDDDDFFCFVCRQLRIMWGLHEKNIIQPINVKI